MMIKKSLKTKKYNKKGQTLLEFVVLFIVIISALIAMRTYIQRGVQGKWKETIDGMGKQYDPLGEVHSTQNMESNSSTLMIVDVAGASGYETSRTDVTNMVENKVETITIE
ncbi:MAG: hypothetical protein PHY73_00635 [Candidatus Omnitrophica bacterium]|nr:hypothetical protein [Candidatus Omnitrophota bacterium]